jgi:predicted NACHT family NTPase
MIDQKLEVTNLIKPLIDSYKALSEEWDNLLEIGLNEYLIDQTDKYYFTNTFIHRGEKVEFYKIYYPIKTMFKRLSTDFNDLSRVFENYKYLTIVGSAGSGKTTLLKHIFLTSLISKFKIPVLVELRFINDYGGDIEKLIFEKTLKLSAKPSEKILKRALKDGKFLFLLDGYDEIYSSKKLEINRQIDLFIDSYSKNNFILSTRPGSGAENFQRFHDFHVQPLSMMDVKNFIGKIVDSDERRKRMLDIIKEQKNSDYFHYLKNPLLLSMFIIAFESHPEIPSRKSSFYRNVFDTLYSKHDGITKNSFPREKLTKLEREDFEQVLNVFGYLTLVDGKFVFTEEYLTDKLKEVINYLEIKCSTDKLIYDLVTPISIIIKDGFEYNFPHRSMQEYFAAKFISKLSDINKKRRAYENLENSILYKSNDESFNVWSLCN